MRECFIFETDDYTRQEASRVRQDGGSICSSADDLIVAFRVFGIPIDGEDFLIAGAFAGGCVPKLSNYLLSLGASSVVIDVNRCRDVSEVISGTELLSVAERQEIIKSALNSKSRGLEGTQLKLVID